MKEELISFALFASFSSLLWRATWQLSIAVLLVWLLCRLIPKMSPVLRCWLWRLVFLKALLTLVWFLPEVRLPLLPAKPVSVERPQFTDLPEPVSVPPVTVPVEQPREKEPTKTVATVPVAAPATSLASARSEVPAGKYLVIALCGIWGAGVLIGVLRLLQMGQQTRRWTRDQCIPVTDSTWDHSLSTLASNSGVSKPRLLTAADIPVPLLTGLRRPAIVLPSEERLTAFDTEARSLMLAHELGHLKRHDLWWGWLSTIVQVLFFFHPLVWLARREEELACEISCDAFALETTQIPPARYGAMLLQAATLGAQQTPASPGILWSAGGEVNMLKKRIVALQQWSRFTARQRWLLVGGLATLSCFGLFPWRVVAQQQPPATPPTPLSFRSIEGKVITPDGQPVAGVTIARIDLERYETHPEENVKTGPDGTFKFSLVGDRKNTNSGYIVAMAPGWGVTAVGTLLGHPVTIRLQPAAAATIDFVDKQGKPVANLPVEAVWLQGKYGDFPLGSLKLPQYVTRTDAQGRARFEGLPQGGTVMVVAQNSRFAKLGPAGTISLPTGQAELHRTVPLIDAISLEGRVTFGPSGKPASGYRVVAIYQNPNKKPGEGFSVFEYEGGAVLSDPQGHYQIRGLRPGKYRLSVMTWNKPWVAPGKSSVVLTEGEARHETDFKLSPAVLVKGQITDIRTGQPVQGVWVGGGYAKEGPLDYSFYAVTGEGGDYALRVPQGEVMVHLRHTGPGAHFTVPGGKRRESRILQTRLGKEYTLDFQVNAQLPSSGVAPVIGRVLRPDGKPAVGAEVFLGGTTAYLQWEKEQQIVRTDSLGRFRFEFLPKAWMNTTGELRARGAGMVSQAVTVKMGAAKTEPVALQLERGKAGSLSGIVRDQQGKPIAGTAVQLIGIRAGEGLLHDSATTDSQGRYRFPVIWPELRLDLSVQPKGYGGQSIPRAGMMELKPGQVKDRLDFVLTPAQQTLSGRVMTPAGKPVSEVTVSASAGKGDFHTCVVDKEGYFLFHGVIDGPLQLNVQPRHAAAFCQTVYVRDSPLRVVVK